MNAHNPFKLEAFIKKHEYNQIKKYLIELKRVLKYSTDTKIIEANKGIINDKILSIFDEVSDEVERLLDITHLTSPEEVDQYGTALDAYVYGMPILTDMQIFKVFKKEKRLKLPNNSIKSNKNVYLGWRDEATKKLFILYKLGNEMLGITCRVQHTDSKAHHICKLCNYSSSDGEVAFVSPICKTSSSSEYRSIGFSVCLDSEKCNERITSVDKLEGIIKEVNNIKN